MTYRYVKSAATALLVFVTVAMALAAGLWAGVVVYLWVVTQ